MNKSLKKYLSSVGSKPLDAKFVREYKERMENEVIPEILEDVRERQRLAAEARYGIPAPATRNGDET